MYSDWSCIDGLGSDGVVKTFDEFAGGGRTFTNWAMERAKYRIAGSIPHSIFLVLC